MSFLVDLRDPSAGKRVSEYLKKRVGICICYGPRVVCEVKLNLLYNLA